MIRRTALAAFSAAAATPLLQIAPGEAFATEGPALPRHRYKLLTLKVGALAKLTSEIALGQAENQWVKQFAGFEVAEQTTLAQVLTDRTESPPVKLTPEEHQILAQLRSLVGNTFDRKYVEVQIQGHQLLRELQVLYLQNGRDRDVTHIAKLALTIIEEHLTHLAGL